MNDARRLWLEIAVAVGLPMALSIVFAFDRLTSSATPPAQTDSLKVQVLEDASRQRKAKALRLAVVPTHSESDTKTGQKLLWDDMGKLLLGMGKGYDQFDVVTPEFIARGGDALAQYDVLFLTCAPGGLELRNSLRTFVEQGGTLYASDWRFEAIAAAFPEFVDDTAIASGTRQDVDAIVSDSGLKEIIGPTVRLRFDLDRWKTAAFRPRSVDVLLYGPFQKQTDPKDRVGIPGNAPLLVKFRSGKGMVIFTSFHNEKQNSETETKLLQYLVFRLVTAGIDASIQTTLIEGGFAPQKSNLLSTPKNNPTVTKTYQVEKAGPLRFALGFRSEGARLKLHIQSPDGKSHTWDGSATVVLDVPNAPRGLWTYSVTALSLPYENFPFTVTVGEKK